MSDPNDKTRLIRRSSGDGGGGYPAASGHDPEQTKYEGGGGARGGGPDQTRIIRRADEAPKAVPVAVVADERTVLVRRSTDRGVEASTPANDLPDGPVVGWVVVVAGPGRGRSVPLGYGMNQIGREAGNRVVLPFGDPQISRVKHATLTYDPRGKKFFIQHGESSNLTYVGDMPVLSPMELKSGELIRLGDTTVLKFIPLCGDGFNWD
ncbi:MAG: FHA domain-containing protein [Verrucomicrobiota bacterium]